MELHTNLCVLNDKKAFGGNMLILLLHTEMSSFAWRTIELGVLRDNLLNTHLDICGKGVLRGYGVMCSLRNISPG